MQGSETPLEVGAPVRTGSRGQQGGGYISKRARGLHQLPGKCEQEQFKFCFIVSF